MNVLPVIQRELRAQARLTFTYWLRVLGAGALMVVAVTFGVERGRAFSLDRGAQLFGCLNLTLMLAIWVLVPLLVADCLSRERREGTLGLLFLTPLTAIDIVIAKGLAHGLRATTLCLAVLPVIMIPFLMGGVAWYDGVFAVLNNFSSLALALSAGLLASASSKRWLRATLLAGFLTTFFLWLFLFLSGATFIIAGSWNPGLRRAPVSTAQFGQYAVQLGYDLTSTFGEDRANFLRVTPGLLPVLLKCAGVTAAGAVLALLVSVGISARTIRGRWQELPPPRWQQRLQQVMCTPMFWVAFLHRWMRRSLERNPIGWLGQRSWTGRLVTWGWFAVMVSIYTMAFTDTVSTRYFTNLQKAAGWLLLVSLAATAAGSFRRERENGVLELLLVSPLSEAQILGGRLRGLWGQFFPALALLLGVWMYLEILVEQRTGSVGIGFFAISFLTLPVIGLYYSLRQENFMSAFLLTVWMGLLLPVLVQGAVVFLGEMIYPNSRLFVPNGTFIMLQSALKGGGLSSALFMGLFRLASSNTLAVGLQLACAGWFGVRLQRDLMQRNFNSRRAA